MFDKVICLYCLLYSYNNLHYNHKKPSIDIYIKREREREIELLSLPGYGPHYSLFQDLFVLIYRGHTLPYCHKIT